MGGVVANIGIWEDLYPADIATAPSPDKSTISPLLASELGKRGANISWKYIYPPSLAVFLAPLDWIPHSLSCKLFTMLLFGSLFWFLVLFRRECDDWNLPSDLANLLVFLVGTGLPVCESVMISNATPFIALSTILGLRSLRRNRIVGSVFSFALAGLIKGVSVVWVPALFLFRRWRILYAGITTGIILLALPHLSGAPRTLWKTFLQEVLPGSRKLYWIGDGNLGLPSFLAWISDGCSLPIPIERALAILQFALLFLVYVLAWRSARKDLPRSEGLALFLATVIFQVFSPICWPHYAFNVIGFLPLLLSMAGVSAGSRLCGSQWISPAVLACSFAFVWFPVGNAVKAALHIPSLGFARTFGYLLMLGWGLACLFRRTFSPLSPACSQSR